MEMKICLIEVNKRSDGSFRKVTVIHRYHTSNTPKENEIVVLPSKNELFVVKKIYHFTTNNTIICVGYVMEDNDKAILSKSINMLYEVVKDGYVY